MKEYSFNIYCARSIDELKEKTTTGHYDLALIDLDLGGGSYQMDAGHTLMILDEKQPACIRIAILSGKKCHKPSND